MDHIGIDIHKRESQICILTEDGELLERRVRTEPSRFAEVLGSRGAGADPPRVRDGKRVGGALLGVPCG